MRRAGRTVFDLSLGNPNLPPPPAFYEALQDEIGRRDPGIHGYMPNAGLEGTREAVAARASQLHGVSLSASDIVMTCGAGGALNVVLKAILNPGEKVLVVAPYFVEYGFYSANHGGVLTVVPSAGDFDLDVDAIERSLPGVSCIIVNSPNNPTGRIYPETTLRRLAEVLQRHRSQTGRSVYLISDEPYRGVAFDGEEVPPFLAHYSESIVCTSYSKELSLAGERIGYIAVNPSCSEAAAVINACIFANRVLGFVNAPALMQRVLPRILRESVDVATYAERRDTLCEGLRIAGYEFVTPQGGLFVFPKAPGGDDMAFVRRLQNHGVLAVPGRGFGTPGYFRLAFCVEFSVITGALEGLRAAFC